MKTDKSICVIDAPSGSYFNTAFLLQPYFKETYYYIPNFSPFPNPSIDRIGTGYKGITRLTDFWISISFIDIFIFPDNGFRDMAQYLRSIGKQVFGGSPMETIEANRSLFENLLERVDLPVAKSTSIKGLNNLKAALKNKKNVWVKVSQWRWLCETFNWKDWTNSNFWLNDLAVKLGPLADDQTIEFLIQSGIDCVAELGTDGYTLNGQLPSNIIWGVETKDCGYIGGVFKQSELPQPIKEVNTKFQPILNAYKANGFYSSEIRYTEDGQAFYTDICARGGCPPLSSILSNITNWHEVIPSLASGIWMEPKYKSKYLCEIILKSNYVKDGWLAVTFPPELEANITFKGCLKDKDGKVWIVPFSHSGVDMVEFGSVITNDDNLDNAIARALAIADQISAYELRYELAAADISKKAINDLESALDITF